MPFKKKTVLGKRIREYWSEDVRLISDHSIWLDHPDWPGYKFSPEGGCMCVSLGEPKILKPMKKKSGYLYYGLSAKGKVNHLIAHRLIARIFCPDYADGLQVNHKNGIKTDNRAENLEWVTASANVAHTFHALGRRAPRGSRVGGSKLKEDQVLEIKRLLADGSLFHREIASRFGVGRECITGIATGASWKHITLKGNTHGI